MTDKRFMNQVRKEATRRVVDAKMQRAHGPHPNYSTGQTTKDYVRSCHVKRLLKPLHINSFVQGAMYALELLKADTRQHRAIG